MSNVFPAAPAEHSRLRRFVLPLAVTLLFLAEFQSPIMGELIVQHIGAADPTTEGWVDQGGSQPVGPIFGDMGFDAWSIDDSSTALGSSRAYSHQLTGSQLSGAMASGWQLSTRLRVIDIPDSLDFSVTVGLSAASVNYYMAFGSQADGDPIVQLVEGFSSPNTLGPSYALEGSGGGYHHYEMRFDPLSGTADLFVDGIERISDYGGNTINAGSSLVQFGAAQSNSTGHGHYNFVQFSTVPEPSSTVLFLVGSCLLTVRNRKRGHSK